MAREDIIVSETFTFDDEGNEVQVKIKKMPALFAEDWLFRFFGMLAKAGVRVPSSALASPSEIIQSMPEGPEGLLLQLKDLTVPDVLTLKNDLFKYCMILKPREDGSVGEFPMTNMTFVDGNIHSPFTLMSIRKQVLKYNYSFLWNEMSSTLVQKAAKPLPASNSQKPRISAKSS